VLVIRFVEATEEAPDVGRGGEMLAHHRHRPALERHGWGEGHQRGPGETGIDQLALGEALAVGPGPMQRAAAAERQEVGRRAADVHNDALPEAGRDPGNRGMPVGRGDVGPLLGGFRRPEEAVAAAIDRRGQRCRRFGNGPNDGPDAGASVGKDVGELAGHGERHRVGGTELAQHPRQRPLQMGHALPERAGELQDGRDRAGRIEQRRLQVGAADIEPQDRGLSHRSGPRQAPLAPRPWRWDQASANRA
jgi:hypothetical protein